MPKAPSKPAPKAAVAVVAPAKPVDLEKLDAVQKRNDFAFDADASGKRALAMLQHVEGLKKERAVKAILAGVYLHQVKAALNHGEFGSWATKHLGKTLRSAQHYMGLAAKFSRSTKLLLPEIIGANQLTLDLQAQDSDGRAVLAKLDKFVGTSGLTDLMHRHGVIKQGGARPESTSSSSSTSTAGGADDGADEPTVDEAEAAARVAALTAIETAEKALLNPVVWHDLTPENAALADAALKALYGKFHDRLLKLKHQSA